MHWCRPRLHPSVLLGLLSVGCSPAPRTVFVPAGPPAVTLTLHASASEVEVGTPVILRAERRSGGAWREVAKDSHPADACWLATPPPAHEDEVADNLRW